MKLDIQEYQEWAEDQWVLYASTSIDIPGTKARPLLRLWANLDGEYKVELNEGSPDVETFHYYAAPEAIRKFNELQGIEE